MAVTVLSYKCEIPVRRMAESLAHSAGIRKWTLPTPGQCPEGCDSGYQRRPRRDCRRRKKTDSHNCRKSSYSVASPLNLCLLYLTGGHLSTRQTLHIFPLFFQLFVQNKQYRQYSLTHRPELPYRPQGQGQSPGRRQLCRSRRTAVQQRKGRFIYHSIE